MRLATAMWVRAFVRSCGAGGAIAVVARHGDDAAGAIFIKVNRLDGTARLFGPAPAGLDTGQRERRWVAHFAREAVSEPEIDAYLLRQVEFDPDLWVIEVEDRAGRHFLDDWLAEAD
jgi:hypothetical protein